MIQYLEVHKAHDAKVEALTKLQEEKAASQKELQGYEAWEQRGEHAAWQRAGAQNIRQALYELTGEERVLKDWGSMGDASKLVEHLKLDARVLSFGPYPEALQDTLKFSEGFAAEWKDGQHERCLLDTRRRPLDLSGAEEGRQDRDERHRRVGDNEDGQREVRRRRVQAVGHR